MVPAMSIYSDGAVTKLREIVATIDQQLVQAAPAPALQAAWKELVQTLALGPAPETRTCPTCHGVGMRAASRCLQCWAALDRLPALAEGDAR